MKHTKIVCTIGPASNTKSKLERLLSAGMNVARLNFSHGTYADHKELITTIRAAAKKTGRTVTLLQDLQGPRIRTGEVPEAGITIANGAEVILLSQSGYKKYSGKACAIPVQYPKLAKFVKKNGHVYIQDGMIDLQVKSTTASTITCRAVQGGTVFSHKGMNAPGVTIETPVITKKDKQDLKFGIRQNVDYVALSFVKDASNIKALRRLIPKSKPIKIIAKIERAEAVKNFDEILEAVDGIMVARGDLGVELGPSAVPLLQKEMIAKCLKAAKPVIVATQMLESMTTNPRPTRAEAADVANAITDHTDAIMLSAESATGKFPVKAVQTMTRIARTVEKSHFDDLPDDLLKHRQETVQTGVAHAAVTLAESVGAKAIIAFTQDGSVASSISQVRPQRIPLILTSNDDRVLRQMNLLWGVHPAAMAAPRDRADLIIKARHVLKAEKIGQRGDVVVIIGNNPRRGTALVEAVQI